MKLKLNQQNNVSILDVLEDVSAQNIPVLLAGITKLLKSGKNKIIINLIEAKKLTVEQLCEIIRLHLVASELKGSIVLVGQGDLVILAMKTFSPPPSVKYFASTDAALRSFAGDEPASSAASAAAAAIAAAPPTDPNDPNSGLRAKLAQLEGVNKALKSKLSNRANADELRKLRFENGLFLQQHAAMEEQLQILVKERKKPFDAESFVAKIKQLETAAGEFLEKEGLLGGKK